MLRVECAGASQKGASTVLPPHTDVTHSTLPFLISVKAASLPTTSRCRQMCCPPPLSLPLSLSLTLLSLYVPLFLTPSPSLYIHLSLIFLFLFIGMPSSQVMLPKQLQADRQYDDKRMQNNKILMYYNYISAILPLFSLSLSLCMYVSLYVPPPTLSLSFKCSGI